VTPIEQSSRTARKRSGALLAAACLVAALATGTGPALGQQPAAGIAAQREAKAMDALAAMGKYLRSLKAFAVRADTVIDEVLTTGQKLQFAGTVDYLVQAPNGLRADVRSDRRQRVFIYDGKSLTLYAPRMRYYGAVAAPATIAEALQVAEQKYDLEVPLADLFLWGTDKGGLEDIKEAAFIGPATIGGKACDHYAFRQDDVDWQVWIRQGSQPLPCKVVITTTAEPSQPQYAAVLAWNLAPKIDKSSFTFAPPKGASRINIAPAATAGKN
jgi:hypothetical protein